MKSICIVGAGAIGGMVAARLSLAGHSVSVVARGAHLAAIQKDGLTLIEADGSARVASLAAATNDMRTLPKQDLLILALKAHQVAPVLADFAALMHEHTVVVPMQNGIPFWYFQRHGGEHEGRIVESVDPAGAQLKAINAEHIIGCVVYPAALIERPGVVRVVEGERFALGEIDGRQSERVNALSALFQSAGLKAPVLDNIRAEIWLKLWGNLSFNPISALTHSTLSGICSFPASRALAQRLMEEAQAIAHKLGIQFRVSIDKRIAGAEKVGAHKTSMLQDVEAGREPEIDALVGSVLELGRLTKTDTPGLDTVYALVQTLAQTITGGRQRVMAVAA